jgi:hypothetical protein
LIVSNVLGFLSFISKSAGFFAFSIIIIQTVCGALRLFLYEFIAEIIFPVSPCLGLGIMHALSGLLSLLINMLANDIILNDPLNESFPCLMYILSSVVCAICLLFVMKEPYKLNRSDYDFGRRSTMITSYGTKGKSSNDIGDAHADQINSLL